MMENKRRYGMVVVFLLGTLGTLAQQKTVSIIGDLVKLSKGQEIYLLHGRHNRYDTVARTVSGIDGFRLEVPLGDGPQLYQLSIKGHPAGASLFLDAGKILIGGHLENWPVISVTGSDSHNDYRRFQEYMAKGCSKRDYVRDFPNSLYTPAVILEAISWSDKEKESLYESLPEFVKSSFYGKKLAGLIQTNEGKTMFDFACKTLGGEELHLHGICRKQKVTLVDFWASWCSPCRAETPEIKRAYGKYHDKGFEVLSVSFDHDAEKWITAVKEDGMEWVNVSNLAGLKNDPIADRLHVTRIPQKYLIDERGRILHKNFKIDELEKILVTYLD